MDMEQNVSKLTTELEKDINEITVQISNLKKFTESFQKDEANTKIDELLAKISEFKSIKDAINHDIEVLQLGDEQEFPKLSVAQSTI